MFCLTKHLNDPFMFNVYVPIGIERLGEVTEKDRKSIKQKKKTCCFGLSEAKLDLLGKQVNKCSHGNTNSKVNFMV